MTLGLGLLLALSSAGCQKVDRELYESAERMVERDKYDEAANKLRFLVSEYPDSRWTAKAYFKMGEINYYYYKKPEIALDSFVHAAQLDKTGAVGMEAQRRIADIYLNNLHNPELAILQYQKILKDFGGKAARDEYGFLIGQAYFGKRDYKQAIIEFRGLIDKFPQSPIRLDAIYYTALCHYIGGEPEKAALIFTDLLRKYHHSKYDYDAQLGLGMSYEEMEQPGKALEVYQRMLAQFPSQELVSKKIAAVTAKIEHKNKE
jgi:TolA-binding protein